MIIYLRNGRVKRFWLPDSINTVTFGPLLKQMLLPLRPGIDYAAFWDEAGALPV